MLQTKYCFTIGEEEFEKAIKRLTNQLWKLIPMKENEEDWCKQLNTVIIEIAGMNEIFESYKTQQFLLLLTKLEGLGVQQDIDFDTYRKTVFESISLLQGLKRND